MLAMLLGAAGVLLCWALSECFNNERSSYRVWNDPTFAIFMCIGDFLLLQFMWGVSMFVWHRAGIDFVHLLQLQGTEIAATKHPAAMVIQSATCYSLVFLVVFIAFNKCVHFALRGGMSLAYAHSIPVLLALYFLHVVFNPFPTRQIWLQMLGRVLAAPFYPVVFRDGYVGDILTSLVRVLIPCAFSLLYVCISIYAWVFNDLRWTISMSDRWWTASTFCRLVLIPLLTLYPLVIRFLQCLRRSVETGRRWPHLVNALKYTSAIVVIAFATFQPSLRAEGWWIASLIGATLFQYSWDLTQDWGIVAISIPDGGGHRNILDRLADMSWTMRSKRLLGPRWVYLAVMGFNLALRFAWTLTLLPPPEEDDQVSLYAFVVTHIGPIIAAAEIVRRMVWGFFRLEFEQIEALDRQPINMDMDRTLMQKVRKNNIPCMSIVGGGSGNLRACVCVSQILLPARRCLWKRSVSRGKQ